MKYRDRMHRAMRVQINASRRIQQITERIDNFDTLDGWIGNYAPALWREGKRVKRMRNVMRHANLVQERGD